MKTLLTSVAGLSLLCSSCSYTTSGHDSEDNMPRLLVGSYSTPGDSALKIYSFNPKNATAELLGSLPVANASFAAFADSGMVYALCESNATESSLSALRINATKDGAETVSVQPVGSASPCYVAISPDGRYAITANYTGGDIALFPIEKDGSLSSQARLISFDGHGPVGGRQDTPHPHCIAFTPDGKYMLVDDLGSDCIWQFAVENSSDSLISSAPEKSVALEPGSGPRHIVFNGNGDTAYLINELSDKVIVLKYDGENLTPVQYIAADTVGAGGAADIHLSYDGKYLYASLRLKHDGIATFSVDPASGLLTYLNHTDTDSHPRNFTFSPDGRYMLVACRDGNSVQIFKVNADSGALTDTGKRIIQDKAVFVRFL